ncbi:MAG: TIR domain-containing protein [Clostridia bacterium]|nr:TIR domain-containing protein [Clostridia bacterium]
MSIFKCKMCGGTIEFNEGDTIGVCDSCGTKQTLPRLDSDRKTNLYDRANHFRRNNEFDKAMSIYENILNEDPTDAEAYWSLVLCRYGIEYVEDPATHRRVPTVNRAQFTSIFDDEDYKSALKNADALQRSIYEDEAKAINEIQKGILEISAKEEPFDVFICYKETDANGRRTPDSVLATDLYHQLTNEGFKVFFSRITLEDKLGQEYEPYIFAALNSAKAMVVLGTKPEHFNAVWVKNEWSRYLALIKAGAKKTLIPAYRDMDPYDLPDEFSHLQAQDMSKLGFMQDLIRGIKKIVRTDEPKQTTIRETVVQQPAQTNTAPLLRRAFMFLEDSNWQSADEYCEKVLDLDPENAEAYLGKLMAELKVKKRDALKDQPEPFDNRNNYKKALRFGDEKLKQNLSDDIAFINARNEEARKTGIYNDGVKAMNAASTESTYKKAAAIFQKIPGFRDADVLAERCLEQAEIRRKNAIYHAARSQMTGFFASGYESAIETFRKIPGWKDAEDQILACERKIEEIKAKEEADRMERERKKEEARITAEKRKKKKKKAALMIAAAAAVIVMVLILLFTAILPPIRYNKAVELYNAGKYEEAIMAFEALNGYKDSETQIESCKTAIKDQDYEAAVVLYEAGKYEEAIAAFEALDGYKDSEQQIEACKTVIKDQDYEAAVALYEVGKYEEAIAAFEALNGYRDSTAKIKETKQKYHKELLLKANVGSYIFFGSYEQDNNTSNGKEDIEWLVLAKEGDRVLVISRHALDCQWYHNSMVDEITWETCSLRKWLNNEFLKAAFSADEQDKILKEKVTADKNDSIFREIPVGNDTYDKLFLLSVVELSRFFPSESMRVCQLTEYAKARGAYCDSDRNCFWWLRSPETNAYCAAFVTTSGYETSRWVWDDQRKGYSDGYKGRNCAVRPAMWINLE